VSCTVVADTGSDDKPTIGGVGYDGNSLVEVAKSGAQITVPSDGWSVEGNVLKDAKDNAFATFAAYYVLTKDGTTVTVALDETAAPATVQNFIKLAEEGFYDGLTFHRIIDGFMMQGGDPNGNGTGGSDQTIKGEFSENGFDNPISHTRGAISMARSNNLNSASSQFFIVQQDSTFLDGQYAAFGFVTEGMDIVDRICEEAQPTDNNGSIAKDRQPVIESIVIRANGESAGAAK
jgi:cyclophilin family peptidyl-prolyl cis-trans isomerase